MSRLSGRQVGSVAAGIALAVGLAACSSTASTHKPVASSAVPNPLVVNDSTAISTLDPASETGATNQLITQAVYPRLVQFGTLPGPISGTTRINYGVITPDLAKSWSASNGGKTYTFHLNTDFRFGDGTPITAGDVVFSFQRAIAVGSGGAVLEDYHTTPAIIESIKAPNITTVVFSLRYADPELLSDWTTPYASIVEPKLVNEHGGVVADQVNTWMASHIAGGGGPFELTSYQPGVTAVLKANPYSPIKPLAQNVIINFVSDPSTLALDASSGEADITLGLNGQAVHSMARTRGLKVALFPTQESEQFGFNTQVAPGNNLDFRKALALATPYESILKNIAFGYGSLFRGEWSPVMAQFDPTQQKQIGTNLSEAKKLLSESGLKLPVALPVVIEEGDLAASEITAALQSTWKSLGVDLQITTLSPATYVDTIEGHKDISYMRLDGPGVPEPYYYLAYDMVCGVRYNLTQTCLPQLDKLLTEAESAPAAKQGAYWTEIDALIIDYAPKIQLYQYYAPVVLTDSVKSFEYDFQIGGGIQTWG